MSPRSSISTEVRSDGAQGSVSRLGLCQQGGSMNSITRSADGTPVARGIRRSVGQLARLPLAVALGLALLVSVAFADQAAAQQTGVLEVTITDFENERPLSGVLVRIVEPELTAVTDSDGQARITGVPAGTQVVTANLIGYNQYRDNNVEISAGQTTELAFEMQTSVLSLQEVVVTGTTDPTEGVKLPMTVSRIGPEQLQVPTVNSALAAVQGKVAGASIVRGSGQPGSGVFVQLRSMTGFETDDSPLLVVDGVILGRSFGGTTADIEAMDIESIEVIKGAAAAALYGSRAAAGVISIETRGASQIAENTTQFQYSGEFGYDRLAGSTPIATAHPYLMNEEGTSLANSEGRDTTWVGRTATPERIVRFDYPGETFDNLRALYRPGRYLSQNFNMAQNTQATDFIVSFTRLDQAGSLENNDGFQRNTGRINLNHRVGERVSLRLQASHTRSFRDNVSGSPFNDILNYPAFVDLTVRDEDGNFLQQPDPSVEVENPLWRQGSRDNNQQRARTFASGTLNFNATSWLSFDVTLSYDRADINDQIFVPRGVPTSLITDETSGGRLDLRHRANDSWNGHVGAIFRQQFGALNTRFTARATSEREESNWFRADGRDFLVPGLQTLQVADENPIVSSSILDIRANGFLGDLALDWDDKYIGSFMVRRDGSSLFGPAERWQTYTRAAFAWRISQEDWFRVDFLDELKVRYAMGEAGGRPGFTDQFELWTVSSDGTLGRNNQGNPNLRPQFTREQEVGLDIIALNNRLQVELVYAFQTSRDQIIFLPAVTMSGFNSVRGNGAVIAGNTVEATIQAFPIRRRGLTWSMNLVMDHSWNEITEWNRSCFWGSNAGRGHERTCEGESAGDFWLATLTRDFDQLPEWLEDRKDEFDINDDGYVVWVGEGNTWRDGLTENCRDGATCWGTLMSEGGQTYRWGEPFEVRQDDGDVFRYNAGSSLPDLNFGFSNSVTWRGFNVFALFRGQVGGKVFNNVRWWQYGTWRHGDFDQRGKPEEEMKTVDYYSRALRSTGGAWANDEFLEDGTFLKLGELAVNYTFNQEQLSRVFGGVAPSRLRVGMNGRNLFTLTNYSGFDPEAGSQFSRVESARFPHLRNFTATFQLTF
ncbi:MAG: SusC/RagA family TonB-linked outer membrane protein [Gemmatimonadales bacterium]|nr:MAG: SusC/RagA family TonB-linked outer membrane protein [Gemmatimonadales bacterium]